MQWRCVTRYAQLRLLFLTCPLLGFEQSDVAADKRGVSHFQRTQLTDSLANRVDYPVAQYLITLRQCYAPVTFTMPWNSEITCDRPKHPSVAHQGGCGCVCCCCCFPVFFWWLVVTTEDSRRWRIGGDILDINFV